MVAGQSHTGGRPQDRGTEVLCPAPSDLLTSGAVVPAVKGYAFEMHPTQGSRRSGQQTGRVAGDPCARTELASPRLIARLGDHRRDLALADELVPEEGGPKPDNDPISGARSARERPGLVSQDLERQPRGL